MAVLQKPKLLYQANIVRKKYIRRFVWSLLAAVAGLAAFFALEEGRARGMTDDMLLQAGGVISLVAAALFGLRALVNLWHSLRLRTETIRIYDKGIISQTARGENKYSWSQLRTYREGGRGLYIGKRPLLQWGAHRLKMQNGQTLKLGGRYGDLRQIGAILRRYAARVTGIQMGQTLRAEKPVKLRRGLTVWPGGVEVGRQEIPWSEIEVQRKNDRLTILRRNAKGRFRPLRRYNVQQVDNVGGFMEVATATIRNHQRERFEKQSER
jgi:hypothetical protein